MVHWQWHILGVYLKIRYRNSIISVNKKEDFYCLVFMLMHLTEVKIELILLNL